MIRQSIDRVRRAAKQPSVLLAGASVIARLGVMLNLLVAARTLGSDDYQLVAYSLTVSSGVQILIDPNSFNYLLVHWHSWTAARRRGSYRAGLRLQVVALLAGIGLSVAVIAVAKPHSSGLAVAASLSFLAGCEGLARFARVTWQYQQRFRWFGGVDVVLAIGRLVPVAGLLIHPDLSTYCVTNLCAAAVALSTIPFAWRALDPSRAERYPVLAFTRAVVPYGASTTLSSIYAQAPAVLIGVFAGVSAGALYSVAARITQSTELIPAAIANAHFPSLARGNPEERAREFRSERRAALISGVLLAIVISAASPLLVWLFRLSWPKGGLTLIVLAVVLIPKFLTYQYVALAMAERHIIQRLQATAVVACLSVALVAIASQHGPLAVAFASLTCETVYLLLLTTSIVQTIRIRPLHLPHRLRKAYWLAVPLSVIPVALLAGSVTFRYSHAWLLVVVVLVACVAMAVYGLASDHDAFSPLPLLSLAFLILFVFRPAYILGSGVTGPTRNLDDLSLNPHIVSALSEGLGLVLLAILGLVFGTMTHRALSPLAADRFWRLRRRDSVTQAVQRIQPLRTGLVIGVTGLLALGVYYHLVSQAGGVGAYVASLSTRSELFFGQGYIAQAPLPLKAAGLVLIGFWLAGPKLDTRRRIGVAILILLIMIGDFLGGGRSALLLGTLLPVLALRHYLRMPLRARVVIPVLVFGLIFFVGSRVATRDSVYLSSNGHSTSASSVVDLTGHELAHLPSSTVGGRDAVPFDSVIRLVEARREGQPLLLGSTYLSIFTFPVPRAIWAGKPLAGANTWFTKKYYPGFYGTAHTETSVSEIGELYVNFGPAGVFVGFWLIAIFINVMYRRLFSARSMTGVVLYPVSLGYVITLVRGDAFHSVTNWALTVGLIVVLGRYMTERRGSPEALEPDANPFAEPVDDGPSEPVAPSASPAPRTPAEPAPRPAAPPTRARGAVAPAGARDVIGASLSALSSPMNPRQLRPALVASGGPPIRTQAPELVVRSPESDRRRASANGSRARHVLICGAATLTPDGHDTSVGDEALVQWLRRALEARVEGLQTTIVLNDRPTGRRRTRPGRVSVRPVRQLAAAISRADLVILGGGTLFQDQAEFFPSWMPVTGLLRFDATVALLATVLRKPVAICAVGAENLSSRRARFLVRAICRAAVSISVRDRPSQELLQGITGRTVLLGADTMYMPAGELAPAPEVQKTVAVSLRHDATDGLVSQIAAALNSERFGGHSVRLIALDRRPEDDQEALARLAQKLSPERCSWTPREATWEQVYHDVASSEVCIGMRLHFSIFASLAQRPTVVLTTSSKTTAFVADLGLSALAVSADADVLAALESAQPPSPLALEAMRRRAAYALDVVVSELI